jgi:hypothetical protein
MAAYEVTHRGPEVEAQEHMARVGQHHDEGHQRTNGASHRELSKESPVHLPLIPGERAQSQVGLCRRPRTQPRHQGAEVIGGAWIAAFAHHRIEPRGAQRGVFGQGLEHERAVRLDHRGPHDLVRHRHTGLGEHPAHGSVMHAQLPGDGSNRPVLAVIQTHDLDLQCARDHRAWPRSRSPAQRTEPREGRQRTPTETAPRYAHAMSMAGSVQAPIGEREVRLQFQRGDVGMGPRGRGLGRAVCYCDRDRAGDATVMRHFLRPARAPSALPGGVRTRPAVAALVASTCTQQRLAPAHRRAFPRAVAVAAVAITADAHLLRTAPAVVQSISLLACLHAPRTQHWTTPRIAGIKTGRNAPYRASTQKARGSATNLPGPSFIRRPDSG